MAAGALSAARAIARLAGLAFLMTASANAASPEIVNELAPGGRLRAAINYGNPVLAQRDAATGALGGVTVDLARELGRRLKVAVDLVPFDTAGKVADSANANVWDVAFLAVDPVRANEIAFTAPYVLIEGAYMVPAGSALRRVDEVDRDGVRIAVGQKSAYDLYLTRTIKRAALVRAPTSEAAIELFGRDKLEVAAGVRQPLERVRGKKPGRAHDRGPLHGHRAGDGHAEGEGGRRRLSARLRRGDEGLGLRRRRAAPQQPARRHGRARRAAVTDKNSPPRLKVRRPPRNLPATTRNVREDTP